MNYKKVLLLCCFLCFTGNSGFAGILTTPEELFKMGKAQFECYETGGMGYFYQVLYLCPKNEYQEEAAFLIAKSYTLGGDWYRAIFHLEKFLKNYPQSKFVEEAKTLLIDSKALSLRTIFPRWSIESRLGDAYVGYGYSHVTRCVRTGEYGSVFDKNEFNSAMYWFDKVINELPKTPVTVSAYSFKAQVYLMSDKESDYKKAIEEFQKGAALDYLDTFYGGRCWILIGDVYKDQLKDRKKAIESYKAVIDRYKDDPDNYFVSYAKAQIIFLSK